MQRRIVSSTPLHAVLLSLPLALGACGGGEEEGPAQRGAPTVQGGTSPGGPPGGGATRRTTTGGGGPVPDEAAPPRPDRASKVLTREDFAPETRDPFKNYNEVENVEVTPDTPRDRQREVRLSDYNFEDLTLIGIVHSGRDVQPRALWVGTDGKSKTIKQGEYFSRAEVLLATVNRDYVEIEVVDDELAKGLNMARGERRAIYLKEN